MTQHGTGPGVLLAYDGDGNRVSEAIGGTTTKYLVDDLNPTNLPQVMDEVVNGSVTRTYAYGLDRISETQLVNSSWVPSFFGYDGGGSVRFLTNSAGTVTDAYDYDAFGMPIRTSGTTANPYHYGGEWLDSGVGLYHLRARYYNQATGRFWARDPVEGETDEPLSFNPYIYAGQDPTDKVDPTGLSTTVAPPGTLPWQPFKPTPTPNQPQARPGGGALAEYIAVIAMVSFAEIAASQRLAEIINCKFQKFATGVEAAVTSNLPPEDAG